MATERKTIAICQASPTSDPRTNAEKITSWMKKAASCGADMALFGEMFLSDYDLQNAKHLSEPCNGPSATAIGKAAKELGIGVIYGYTEVDDDRYYNSLMFINSKGECLANYRKVHLWPTEVPLYSAGNTLSVVDWEGWKVGLGICVDVCMHEYVSSMVLNGGAQLVIIANALLDGMGCVKAPRLLVPARALENRCYIAYVCLAGERYQGMSRVYSPLAECLVSANTNREVLLTAVISDDADIPFCYHTFRRPEIYVSPAAYETEFPWKKQTRSDVQKFFKHRATYYDQQMETVYNGPSVAARALASLIKEMDQKILDVAAGTGLVGEAMHAEGFTNLFALDMSQAMLEKAKQKRIYRGTILGEFEVEALKIPSESFYACVCVGAFLSSGFLPPSIAVEEMVRIVEVGGYVLLMWNATELEEPQCAKTQECLDEALKKVISSSQCEYLQKISVPQYLQDCTGTMTIFKKVTHLNTAD